MIKTLKKYISMLLGLNDDVIVECRVTNLIWLLGYTVKRTDEVFLIQVTQEGRVFF